MVSCSGYSVRNSRMFELSVPPCSLVLYWIRGQHSITCASCAVCFVVCVFRREFIKVGLFGA